MPEYYRAYDDRYRKAHEKGLLWASSEPTPELLQWLSEYDVPPGERICDVGCGEGRDALALAERGYRVTAVDISEVAINKCRELAAQRGVSIDCRVGDALQLPEVVGEGSFKWLYSIGTLHMLVLDDDRQRFLRALRTTLVPGGRLLLVNMGDGETQRASDPSQAFTSVWRTHDATGERVKVASTTYRGVDWETHRQELRQAGFELERTIDTQNREHGRCMTVYLKRPAVDPAK